MFTVIVPALLARNSALVSKIIKSRESFFSPRVDALSDTENTVYIAYENKPLGVFASCRLNLLKDSPVAFYYQKRFNSQQLKTMREASLISFEMDPDHKGHENGAFFIAIQDFYRGLYQVFINLAVAQNLSDFVTLGEKEQDHQDCVLYGSWPFQKTHKILLNKIPFMIGELPMGRYHHREPIPDERFDTFIM